MESFAGLLWSLLVLSSVAAGLARIVGFRALEEWALRGVAIVVIVLIALPLLTHETAGVRGHLEARSHACDRPEVVVVGLEELALGGLVVAGHGMMALWLLRRRARGEEQRRVQQQREADRRRERGRLPPRDLDGGAS